MNLWQLLTRDMFSLFDVGVIAAALIVGYCLARNTQDKPLLGGPSKPKVAKDTGESPFTDYVAEAFNLDSREEDIPTVKE